MMDIYLVKAEGLGFEFTVDASKYLLIFCIV